MADLRELAAQRLIEPGAVIEGIRAAVAAFEDPGLLPADAERLARMVRERSDHSDEVRLANHTRLWDWAGHNVPPAAVDADLLDDYAYEWREALARADLSVGLSCVPDYANELGIADPSPLVRRMMARVIQREMASGCERSAKRYRRDVVPYLDPPEPDGPSHPYQDTLDLLDELEAAVEPFPTDYEMIDWMSSPRPKFDDGEDVTEHASVPGQIAARNVKNARDPVPDSDRPAGDCGPPRADALTNEVGTPRTDGLDPSNSLLQLWGQFATDMKAPRGTWNDANARHSKAVAKLWERLHPGLQSQPSSRGMRRSCSVSRCNCPHCTRRHGCGLSAPSMRLRRPSRNYPVIRRKMKRSTVCRSWLKRL